MTTKYIDFQQISVDDKLREQFIAQATGMNLGNIIKKSKGLVRAVFHQAIGMPDVYVVSIIGSNDGILIKLANECNFPRGFPVLWIPNVKMQYFGFYPKFSNDDRQTVDDLSEFDNVTGVDFFKKWSGFLGQLMVFKIGNEKYWTVASKNSAINISPFVADAKRIFEPFVTDELADAMIKQQLHICAEIMSQNDQVHGTRVIKETPIVTAIGVGQLYDPSKTNKNSKNNNQNSFANFFSNEALVDFCVKYHLPCDSAISIINPIAAKTFIKKLSLDRDFMTDDKLMEMLKGFEKDVIVRKGTVVHSDILGNCLEGLVIKLKHQNNAVIVKKYKFASYTIRTMLLREEFNNFVIGNKLTERVKTFISG